MAMRLLQHTSGSGNVKGVEYDVDTQTLLVHFKGGSYKATGVDEETALGFERAGSAGTYYNQNIRDQFLIAKV